MLKDLIKNETNKYAKKFYQNVFEDGFDLVDGSRYESAKKHVHVKCPKGHEYKVGPHSFVIGHRCKKCSDGIKQRHLKADGEKRFIERLRSEGYESLSDYTGANEHVKVRCQNGHEYKTKPGNFLTGYRCMKCNSEKTFAKKSLEFVERLENNGYKTTDEYTYNGNNKKVKVVCPVGHVYEIRPMNFGVTGSSCSKCFRDGLVNIFKEAVLFAGYKIIGDGYVKAKNNVTLECSNGHIYKTNPDNFMSGARCMKCQYSKGEKKIEEYLSTTEFDFISQKKMNGCRNSRPLPFDFAVYKGKELLSLIEFQGKQHYQQVDFFGGAESFEKTVENDKIKQEYCDKNGIYLIKIPYWDYEHIEEILELHLNNIETSKTV